MRASTGEGVLEQLRECVRIPSPTPPGDASGVAAWVEEWGLQMGAKVSKDAVWDGANNVFVSLCFGGGPRLVLNTHMDVVDPSTQSWQTDPYVATPSEGRIHGRGTVDAKGSLVAMLAAMERVAASPDGVIGEVLLTAVVAEEAGGLGSLHMVEGGFDADAAIVGEPTELEVAYAHKGTYMRELVFLGTAAHSASPWLGHNAAADAAAFIAACEEETVRLAAHPHPVLGPATMTVTKIHSGSLQNTVPDKAVILVDRRMIPGETHAQCDDRLQVILETLKSQRVGMQVAEPREVVATIPSQTDPEHPIATCALAAVSAVCGLEATPTGFNAGCDMSKLVGAGVPTVILGPGSLAQAHNPDEYVLAEQVTQAVAIYESIIRNSLAPDGPIAALWAKRVARSEDM